MLLFSRKDNNRPDKKIMLSFFSQFGLINLDNYYKDDETLIRENENYIMDTLMKKIEKGSDIVVPQSVIDENVQKQVEHALDVVHEYFKINNV